MQDQREMKKPTYPQKYGIKEAKIEVERLVKEAKKSLKIFNEKAEVLNALADYIVKREK